MQRKKTPPSKGTKTKWRGGKRKSFPVKRQKFNSFKKGEFKSGLEVRLSNELKALAKGTGSRLSYENKYIDYVLRKRYLPDFEVILPSGRRFYIEAKGYFRPEDRTKMVAAKAFNPDIDIRLIFGRDDKLRKGSDTRYSDWCRKHGFEFAIGHAPDSWFKED